MTTLYGEFADAAAMAGTIRELRTQGVRTIEAYLPYAVPEVERALDAEPSRLSYAVAAAGFGAAAGTYGLQWLLNAYLYPLNVGGRPPHFPLAFVPITFEMGVLFASLTAFVAVLFGGRLLRLWDPVSDIDGIESATGVRFWLEVRGVDTEDDVTRITGMLRDGRATAIRRLETPS